MVRSILEVAAVVAIFLGTLIANAMNAEEASSAEQEPCEKAFAGPLSSIRRHLTAREVSRARASLERLEADLVGAECPVAEWGAGLLEVQILLDEGSLALADEQWRQLTQPVAATARMRVDEAYAAAAIAHELGQYRRARAHYERWLDPDLVSPALEAVARYNIAVTHLSEAPDEERREAVTASFRTALSAAREAEYTAVLADIHVELGRLGADDEGRRHLELARALAETPGDAVKALGAASVELLEADPATARRWLDEAFREAERVHRESGYFWPRLLLWLDAVPVIWATSPRDAAIQEILTGLEQIEDLWRLQGDAGVKAGFLSVWTEIYQHFAGLLLEAGRLPRAFHVVERYRARVLAESLLAPGVSTGSEERATHPFAGLQQITDLLAPDEALLAFQTAPWRDVYGRFGGGSWVIAIHRDGVRVHRLPELGILERRIRLFLGLIAQRVDAGGAAARLYSDLLEAALAELPATVDKLVLVPDGDLHLLPFGALRPRPDALPVAARFELATVPSATLWRRWRERSIDRRAQTPAALVFANPLPRGLPVAPLRTGLGPLPHAAAEGRKVVSRMGRGSLLRMGAEASEEFLVRHDLRRFGLLHFAAHAVVDDVHPERSAVLLAGGAEEDGELRPAEIATLDLAGQIVVLSACRSASGGVLEGEGVMSLARAFFEAGASTVIGSLWPLDDREAGLFFDAFYRHLEQGQSLRRALRDAQADLRSAGAPTAAWAGVALLGDGSRAPLEAKHFTRFHVAGLGALLLVAAVALFAAGRRHGSRPSGMDSPTALW